MVTRGGFGDAPFGAGPFGPKSTGTTTTFSVSSGSFVLTGEAATFRLDFVATQASFALTGELAPLKVELACSYGSFVLTGQDASYFIQPGIADTDALQVPINCILAGQQLIRDRYRENNLFDPGLREGRKIQGVSVQLDRYGRFKPPSFTTITNKRGYD